MVTSGWQGPEGTARGPAPRLNLGLPLLGLLLMGNRPLSKVAEFCCQAVLPNCIRGQRTRPRPVGDRTSGASVPRCLLCLRQTSWPAPHAPFWWELHVHFLSAGGQAEAYPVESDRENPFCLLFLTRTLSCYLRAVVKNVGGMWAWGRKPVAGTAASGRQHRADETRGCVMVDRLASLVSRKR